MNEPLTAATVRAHFYFASMWKNHICRPHHQQRKTAQNEGITGDKTEAYTSGNAAVNSIQSGEGKKFMLSPSFTDEFDSWVKNGVNNARKTFNIGRTSNALKSIGLSDKPITWDSKIIIRTIGDHPEMSFDILKRVPEILENPIVIMKSKQKASRLTMLGEIILDGKPVLAVLNSPPRTDTVLHLTNSKLLVHTDRIMLNPL